MRFIRFKNHWINLEKIETIHYKKAGSLEWIMFSGSKNKIILWFSRGASPEGCIQISEEDFGTLRCWLFDKFEVYTILS